MDDTTLDKPYSQKMELVARIFFWSGNTTGWSRA
jgi:hypothetical protein